MGKKKRALFSPKFKTLREGKFSNITKENDMKIKFVPRAKRKALEEKLATLEEFSDEAKAIRGQLGWGEPAPPAPVAPPAPKPAPKPAPAPPAPKPAPKPKAKKAPVKKAVAKKTVKKSSTAKKTTSKK
tara:strand:+ start:259 stop:645 length:387 start_codon:yes stop_codon:yes gene_type:complete